MMSFLVDVNSLVHVESYEARLVQLLPQSHFHAQVVVDVEAHRVVGAVVVVVRVVLIVWGHEAVRAHLVTGVQRSQQHDSSCGRTVNVLVFCIQSVRSQESVSEVTDEVWVVHLQLLC